MRYEVAFKEEKKKNDYVLNLDLYLYDIELKEYHLVRATKSLQNRRIVDAKLYDDYINMFDLSLVLVDYDIQFYDLLKEEFITSKLNKIVIEKNLGITLRKPVYKTKTKEELAYIKEEKRATYELIKKYKR